MVLLNLWATWCGPCETEFPAMEEAYRQFRDKVAVVALSVEPNDTDAILADYVKEHALSFLVGRDEPDFSYKFGISGIPTSVVIDRNGIICMILTGAMPDPAAFATLFGMFAGEDYTGPLLLTEAPGTLPAVDREDPAALAAALETEAAANPDVPYIWPMVRAEADGRTVVTPANVGRTDRTTAELDIPLTVEDGSVIAVTAKLGTRPAFDKLTLLINGIPVKGFSGEMDWFTYAIPVEHGGSVTLTLSYSRKSSDAYEDEVFIDRVAVLTGDEAAAALAANPIYPVIDEISLVPVGENIREIVVNDPLMLDVLIGCSAFYIVNDDTVTYAATISPDVDPDVDVFYDDSTGTFTPIRDGLTGDSLTFTGRVDSVGTGGNPYSMACLYWNDLRGSLGAVVFRDEANANSFFYEFLPSYGFEDFAWSYPDGSAPARDLLPEASAAGTSEFTVRYVDQDGNPVPGVWCQVCDESTCSLFTSDANGECRFTLPSQTWKIHTLRVPQGYEGDTETVTCASPEGEEIVFTLNRV
ncbi:MAG: TlpA family protein disulfide reductase [Clostridia bacterium]|nr:TlpA family protein disulfide reductase [Clostridia bacterium]